MCQSCDESGDASVRTGRKKLWEIQSGWHCMIIGTCVSMGQLRSLATKLAVQTTRVPATDHDIHSAMVYLTSRERKVGKAIHKLLERRHGAMVTRFAKVGDADGLARLWREAVARGEVAAALWALMSHPATTEALEHEVFGEVHMLSHQVGAASRADLRQIHNLEKEKSELEQRLARQQDRLRSEMSRRDETIRELNQLLEQDRAELRRLGHASSAATQLDGLKALVVELQRHVDLESTGRRAAETATRAAKEQLEEMEAGFARLSQEAEELRTENAALEARVLMALSGDRVAMCDQSCGRPDLCGRCILYVGGRVHQVQHLRRIVEECNGTLIHHDGGFEDGMGRLGGLLGQADAVFFPVDCVSHMAHDQVKRMCKRWEKPFVPVRRSGLGAFMRALAVAHMPG